MNTTTTYPGLNPIYNVFRIFRDALETREKFPLNRNEYGFYTPEYTEHGHNLRCPNCGNCTWNIKSYQHIECTICYKGYSNLGVLGLKDMDGR